MSCRFSSSIAAEANFPNVIFSNSNQLSNCRNSIISFNTSQLRSIPIRKNPSGPRRARTVTRVQSFYSPEGNAGTLYELLGIDAEAAGNAISLSDIKKAYKQMARKYHPDVSPPDRVDEYTRRFIMVHEAYETLSNPQSRALYDRDLAMDSSVFASSRATSKTYRYENDDQRGEWRRRWQSQLDELTQRNMNPRMTWGARMRQQR